MAESDTVDFGVRIVVDPDGYRPNVGIVLMHPDGRVFWARRVRRDGWQFPQGGMNTDETPLEAMYRELREETGLLPDHVAVLGLDAPQETNVNTNLTVTDAVRARIEKVYGSG